MRVPHNATIHTDTAMTKSTRRQAANQVLAQDRIAGFIGTNIHEVEPKTSQPAPLFVVLRFSGFQRGRIEPRNRLDRHTEQRGVTRTDAITVRESLSGLRCGYEADHGVANPSLGMSPIMSIFRPSAFASAPSAAINAVAASM